MLVRVRSYLGRSRFVAELVEDWQIACHAAQRAWDAQDLLSECIDLGNYAKHTWDCLAQAI